MIPYQDLLRALSDWRARQGLPPLHGSDYLGTLQQDRIDTSQAIAAVTGSLELLDIDTAGAEYDYDEPLAPPPMDSSAGWSEYDSDQPENLQDAAQPAGYEDYGDFSDYGDESQAAAHDEFGKEPQPSAYDEYGGETPPPSAYDEYGGETPPPSAYDEYGGETPPPSAYNDYGAADAQPEPAYPQDQPEPGAYDYGDPAFDVNSVGDSTAIYHDLAPSGAPPPPFPGSDPNLAPPPPPVFGFDDDDDDESTMIGSMPSPTAVPSAAQPVTPPPSTEATAIIDTSLALNAAAQIEDAGYGQPGGGVPSEPVYDSMAAAAEYQAERVAEQEAAFNVEEDEHTYVPSAFQDPSDAGFAPPEADEPPPLEPPPLAGGDDDFDIHFDDDEF